MANLVKDCNTVAVELLVLQSYDHLMDVYDEKEELGVMNLANLTGSQQMVEILQKYDKSKVKSQISFSIRF